MMLERILQHKLQEINSMIDLSFDELSIADNDFLRAVSKKPLSIIAELKAASPSAGILSQNFNPLQIAACYDNAGADAISVLTDKQFFHGDFEILQQVSNYVIRPTLCKDFILDEKQIKLARYCGASACLLIVKILADQQLRALKDIIESLGMVAVIEIHDQLELDRALILNPQVIAINNRNLSDFSINVNNCSQLCQQIPEPIVVISASGITKPADILSLPKRVNSVLIGTALMKATDPVEFIGKMKALVMGGN